MSAVDPFDNWANAPGWYYVDYPYYYGSQQLTNKDGDIALGNLDLHSYQNLFRVTYYNNTTFKKTWLFSAYVPVGRLDLLSDHRTGVGDTTVVAGYYPLDDQTNKTFFGFASYVDIPTGAYDKNRIANLGDNVWRVRPMLVFAKFIKGFDLEASLKYNIIMKNKDTQLKKGNQIILETYAGYFLRPTLMAGAHLNYTKSSNNEQNGVEVQDSALKLIQAGPSVIWMPKANFNVMLQVVPDIFSRNTVKGTLFLTRWVWKYK